MSKKKIPYTISANLINLATELKDGHQNIFTLSHINGAMNFFYRPTHYDHSMNVYLYSYYGRTVFSALVWDLKESRSGGGGERAHYSSWPFP